MDCGPTCLRMISRYYGKSYSVESIREVTGFARTGVSLLGISEAAEKIGFRTRGTEMVLSMACSYISRNCHQICKSLSK